MPVLPPTLPVLRVDPALCPLCGEANACALEIERHSGVAQAPCWCMSAVFGESLQAQLQAMSRPQACICARCAASVTPS